MQKSDPRITRPGEYSRVKVQCEANCNHRVVVHSGIAFVITLLILVLVTVIAFVADLASGIYVFIAFMTLLLLYWSYSFFTSQRKCLNFRAYN